MARNPLLEWRAPEGLTRGEGRAFPPGARGVPPGPGMGGRRDPGLSFGYPHGLGCGKPGGRVVTVDLSVSYLRPDAGVRLYTRAQVVRDGEDLLFVGGRVANEAGVGVARGQGIF
jgi:hypothetical protein